MSNIVWKAFRIGDLFIRSTSLAMGANQKDLDLVNCKDEKHSIALISASRNGSGRVGYIEDDLIDSSKVSINKITFDDQWGFTFFQQEKFVITGGHNAILEVGNSRLKSVLDDNLTCYSFFSLVINNITIKSGIFGYGYKINNKLDREIILLPCLEVTTDEEYVWEENDRRYTLAVDYIRKMMKEAKELREQKTIRLYEAERKKYEAERKKYEAGYKKERSILVWKALKLKDLFETNTKHRLSKVAKAYNTIDEYKDGYIANVTAGMYNNGVANYIESDSETERKKSINKLTISTNGAGVGSCFYHDYYFISTGDNKIIEFKNTYLRSTIEHSAICGKFFALVLTKMFTKGVFSWTYKINDNHFNREMILLPCLEVADGEEFLCEENGKHYALAIDYISYIYLSGKVNYNQALIDNYTYQY